jgi:hypothetical protein
VTTRRSLLLAAVLLLAGCGGWAESPVSSKVISVLQLGLPTAPTVGVGSLLGRPTAPSPRGLS